MPAIVIRVKLPTDRTKTGTLEMVDPLTGLIAFGPVPVLGRAARDTARLHGNPSGSSVKPYGDTPLGEYDVPAVLASGDGTPHPALVYGSAGVVVLDPVGGEAAQAKANGRTGLLIHAGRQTSTPTPIPSQLRPTNGCIRMLEPDLRALIQAMRLHSIVFPSSVRVEATNLEGPSGAKDEAVNDGDPPPLLGSPTIP